MKKRAFFDWPLHSALKLEQLCKNNKNICTETVIIQDHFKKDKNDLISLFLFPTSQLLFEAGPELLTKIKKVDFTQFTQIYSNVFKFTQFTQYCTFSGFFFCIIFRILEHYAFFVDLHSC